MGKRIHIADIGDKIELALKSDTTPVKTRRGLLEKLPGVEPDYFSRLMGGSRRMSEHIFIRICDALQIEQKAWYDDLETFGRRLGFTRRQIGQITRSLPPGIDFRTRIRDPQTVHTIYENIKGYWESFYYSVSNTDRRLISRDLFIVDSVDDDFFITCRIIDGMFEYIGYCFPMPKGHLCFILEKVYLHDEIIMYVTNRPDRSPPKLNGVILCQSGGVSELAAYPSASLVAFRYLGPDIDSAKVFYPGINDAADLADRLKGVPGYIDPNDSSLPARYHEVIRTINNTILPNAVPFALRMTSS